MRQILNVVILGSQRGMSGWWEGRVGFLEYGQDCRKVDWGRGDGRRRFEDAVIREELHLLQTGSGGSCGGGTRAGVERVRLRAVCHSVLLQLQVASQGVNVMNNLVTRRGSVTLTAEVRNNKQCGMRGRNITCNNFRKKKTQ